MSLVPPVSRDGWSYSGEFHVEASGHNRHRRATIPELIAVFSGADGSKDRPAHWYEAQLMHYGLPPSKNKGTAKMRLFEAVNSGNLAVPPHILKVESELKKEWTKREREAKQALKQLAAPASSTPAKGSNKRKADTAQLAAGPGTNVNINLALSIGPQGNVQVAPAEPAAKKAKTTKPVSGGKAAKPAEVPGPSTQTDPRAKQTARRGTSSARGGGSVSSSRTSDTSGKPGGRRQIQTARRGRPFTSKAAPSRPAASSGQAPQFDTTPLQWDSPDDPPPPYPGSPEHLSDGTSGDGQYGQNDDRLPPLGLLNGRYHLRCIDPPEFADDDSNIIFTLDGDALWGSFEIGPVAGILRLDERPWRASYEPLYFQWRGEDLQGGTHAETDDGSYIKFLGDGKVVGRLGFYRSMLEFEGFRASGQQTRSEISPPSMRREWEQRWL
ncbi:3e67e048-1967-40d9-b43f-f8ed2fc0b76b [Thermothielavioides terrestris]|jgi:hypothetical protein|uniref:Uncharacterized protein n=2 Tax=Thermothielavioides terrestris TaxID=2587410 RepID=G2QUJ7_THETT|nr:uncharacterized protein THITE_2110813 [Thermothielavioides terrestris NRRL 8126]AEO64552.1 hypothetical protein THITE_2110813 [Thermothielavioides terrestris NRRL 8126]SPQ26598.1 3e67e048-1967-40d9-b43f-f8ed2fc0b76b [Thermothielavioides terrestris]